MTYLVCISNLSVPAVLTLTKENPDFKVITDQLSIFEFIENVFSSNNVILIPHPKKSFKRSIIYKPFYLFSYKNKLIHLLGKPVSSTIYFFYNAYGFHISWWLSKISANNKIIYIPDINISMWKIKYTLKSVYEQIKIYINYWCYTLPAWNGEKFFYSVSNSFLKKNNVIKLPAVVVDWNYINKYVVAKLNLDGKKVLMLSGNTVADKLVEEYEFIKKNDSIIEHIEPGNIAIKTHPRFDYLFSKEKECFKLQSYIPANIILQYFDFIVGYTSSVLFEAANTNKKAISLIDIFIPESEERKNTYKVYLKENLNEGKIIYFPQTLKELFFLIEES